MVKKIKKIVTPGAHLVSIAAVFRSGILAHTAGKTLFTSFFDLVFS